MSIKKGDKQPLVVYCHAGCTHTDIMAALGVAPPSLNGNGNGNGAAPIPANGQLAKRPAKPKQPLGEMVARYPYYDLEGNFLYEKRRYEPKTFRIKNKKGWGLGEHKPVLYNLLGLVKTPLDWPVFVVEGEKDVDALNLFATAVCNFDGASKDGQNPKWRGAEYNEFFKGRRVVVLPDNDKPGHAHATAVAESVAAVAEWVKIVELPGLAEHGDVSDWLEQGGTPKQLWAMVEAAPLVRPKQRDFSVELATTEDDRKGLRYLGYQIRLNQLDNTLEVNGQRMDDITEANMRAQMYDLGFRGLGRIADAILVEAGENTYHPIREYMDTLVWDGVDWIDLLTSEYLTETTGLGYTAFLRWMIGSVARVYRPGERNFMLVWDGPQEVGKSTLARWLCPLQQYHIEEQINTEDKDIKRYLATRWIWEVAEVDATTKRQDVSSLKDFISKREVTIRPAYARHDLVRPSLASFIGTINSDGAGFLRDKTGHTRFVTIRFEAVNFAYVDEIDPTQLWAQAVALYKKGEPWRLTGGENELRNRINESYETESYLEAIFNQHYKVSPKRTDVWCSSIEIIQVLEDKGLKGSQRINLIELQTILQRRGAVKARKTDGGKKDTVYLGVWYEQSLAGDEDDLIPL
jgi:predicted P-loop ATPase